MNKPNCEQCRYYLSIDETKGFCGNIRVDRIVRAAAHACGQYEPYKPSNAKTEGQHNARCKN